MRLRGPGEALLLVTILFSGCLGGGGGPKQGDLRAAFEYAPTLPGPGELIQFQDRSEGAVVNHTWRLGEAASYLQNPTHAFAVPGTYEIRLTVTDADGRNDTAVQNLTLAAGATNFTVDFTFVVRELTVEFAPRVQPEETVLLRVGWDFGDGTTSTDFAPEHTFSQAGLYNVTLRGLADEGLQTVTRLVPVGVGAPPSVALAAKPWVVVALVDSGINPYHEEFRDERFVDPPSAYVTGFPADARRLDLSLGLPYAQAVKADEAAWKAVKAKTLYWIPGTRIVGAASYAGVSAEDKNRILDDDGHGTATASLAAGKNLGTCPNCLLVVLEGLTKDGEGSDAFGPLYWALSQPWIDVVSNSWNVCVPLCEANPGIFPPGVAGDVASRTRAAVESGKTVVFAAGNGVANAFDVPQPTWLNALTGPDWVVTVGAADGGSGATVVGTGRPVDVTSYGLEWKGASHTSTSGVVEFSGTSAAAPIVAGAFGHVTWAARDALGDTDEGPRQAVVAEGVVPAGLGSGALIGDAKLTRLELEKAVYRTARVPSGAGPLFPATLPGSPASFAYSGWGLVDKASQKDAVNVVLGKAPLPARAEAELWAQEDSTVRRAIWGNWNPGA